MVGSRSRILHRPLPENDPKQRQPDISLAQELLNWKPQPALKDGLTRTIVVFRWAAVKPAPTRSARKGSVDLSGFG
jgi:hypothetical protein